MRICTTSTIGKVAVLVREQARHCAFGAGADVEQGVVGRRALQISATVAMSLSMQVRCNAT